MAMLGHQVLPTQQGLAEAAQPEVNEEVQQVAALEAEIGVANLISPDTGGFFICASSGLKPAAVVPHLLWRTLL